MASCSPSAFSSLAAGRTAFASLAWGTLLAAAIVLYNFRHKANPFGPRPDGRVPWIGVLRGGGRRSRGDAGGRCRRFSARYLCRRVDVDRQAVGSRAGWSIPVLIAGISIVDAVVIALERWWMAGLDALAGFPADAALQRIVPGT